MRPPCMSQARVTSLNLHKQQLPMATTHFDASMVCPAAQSTEQGSEYGCSDTARSRTRPACRLFRTPLLEDIHHEVKVPPTQWAAENTQPCAPNICHKLESLPLTCTSNKFATTRFDASMVESSHNLLKQWVCLAALQKLILRFFWESFCPKP